MFFLKEIKIPSLSNVHHFCIDLLVLLYLTTALIFSTDSNGTIYCKLTAFCLMILLFFYDMKTQCHFKLSSFYFFFTIFVAFSGASSFWAIDSNLSFQIFLTLSQNFILIFLLHIYIANERDGYFLVKCLTFSGTFLSLYVLYFYGISNYFYLLVMGVRVGGDITNTNIIGMAAAMSFLMHLWWILYEKKYWNVIPMLICLLVAFGSGSRKVVLSVFLGLSFLFILKDDVGKMVKNIFWGAVVIILLILLLQLPFFDVIRRRFDGLLNLFSESKNIDASTQIRKQMIEYGLIEFFRNPMLGIGAGNSSWITMKYFNTISYLHNNYVELLASVGVLGFVQYYGMYISSIIGIIKKSRTLDSLCALALTLIIVRLLLQFGLVEYYDKVTYMFLLFFCLAASGKNVKTNKLWSL